MKKKMTSVTWFSILMLIAFLATTGFGQAVVEAQATDVKVIVDSKEVPFPVSPIIVGSGTTLVPMRAIFEAMGADVRWDQQSRKVTAFRDGNKIELTIGSLDAYTNNKLHKLVEKPRIENGRTLVPVRFIAEAYGDKVVWDQTSRTVTVTTGKLVAVEPPIQVVENTFVTIDGLQINDISSIYVKSNASYLPILNVLNAINIEVLESSQHISFTIKGKDIQIGIDTNHMSIDGRMVEVNQPLLKRNDEWLVNARVLADLMGGSVSWNKDRKVLAFNTGNTVFGTMTLPKETVAIARPTNISEATLVGDRRLMVSDNPESLYERTITGEQATLWHDHVISTKEVEHHRILGHHHNKFKQPIKIGVTIENQSDKEMEIVDLKGASRSSSRGWAVYDIGMQIAGLTLNDKLSKVNLDKTTVAAYETVTLDSFLVDADNMFGFMNEFSIKNKSNDGSLNYKIRITMSKDIDYDLTKIMYEPVQLDGIHSHTRGSWEQSTISTKLPVFDVAIGEEKSFNISNRATDNLLTKNNSFDSDNSLDNIGHYGATYQVILPFVNETDMDKKVLIRIGSRGGQYAGAVKTPNGTFVIPTLAPATEAVNVMEYTVKPGTSELELEVMHGSGSALPIAVNMKVMN